MTEKGGNMKDSWKYTFLEYLTFNGELKGIQNMGTSLVLDGSLSTPEDVASACVLNEEAGYHCLNLKKDSRTLYFAKDKKY